MKNKRDWFWRSAWWIGIVIWIVGKAAWRAAAGWWNANIERITALPEIESYTRTFLFTGNLLSWIRILGILLTVIGLIKLFLRKKKSQENTQDELKKW